MEISPNPAFDIINVKADFDEAIITDLSGKQVADLRNLKGSSINISDISKGAYFITLKKNNQLVGTGKFVKR